MKKNKIPDIILCFVAIIILMNTIIAYVSYKRVCDDKLPVISSGKKTDNKNVTYKQGLYKIVVIENDDTREVSLKLFFLK